MNIRDFIDNYLQSGTISPDQVRLLEVAAVLYKYHHTKYYDSNILGVEPGDEISKVTYIALGGKGAGVGVMGGYEITLVNPGGNSELKGAPVADLAGWENRTFMYYDSDIGMHHELSHVILGLLGISTPSGDHGSHSELMVAALAKVAKEAGIDSLSESSSELEKIQVGERVRELYGLSNQKDGDGAYAEFIFASSTALEPTNYSTVLPQLIAWANGADGSYENIFNANRDFYALAGLDPEHIPSAYRVGYVFHQDSADANEDGAWKTYASGAGGNAQGTLNDLIQKGEDIAWLGNQYANTMQGGGGKNHLDGGAGNDTLTGGGKADQLYGGDGDDNLEGKGGTDYLEGGQGTDTYILKTGSGNDTILDTDGSGQITLDGKAITGSTGVAAEQWAHEGNVWRDSQNNLTYVLTLLESGQKNLLIRLSDGSTLELKDWTDGELGIVLGEAVAPPPPAATDRTIRGDLQPQDMDPATPDLQIGLDELGNILVTDIVEANREDVLYDSTGNDHLLGLGGNDELIAYRGGDDLLEGGAGEDLLEGRAGNDRLAGGADSDVLQGGADNDRLFAAELITDLAEARLAAELQGASGLRGDWLSGGEGEDTYLKFSQQWKHEDQAANDMNWQCAA